MAFLSNMSLQTRVIASVVMGLGFILGVLGYFGLQSVRQGADLVVNERITLARAVSAEIDEIITHVSLELETMASKASESPDDHDLMNAKDYLKEFYRHLTIHHHAAIAGASAIGIVRQDGAILWIEPEAAWSSIQESSASDHPVIQKALRSGRSSFGQAIVSVAPAFGATVSVVTPVVAHNGKVLGAFFADINPLGGIASLNPTWGLGEIGYPIEIINDEGIVLGAMGENESPGIISHHFPLVKPLMTEGKAGGTIHAPNKEEEHIVAFVPLRTAQWGVILEQKGDTALMLPNALRRRFILFGSLATLGTLILAWLSTRTIVIPIKNLTIASRRIATGELDQPITPSGQSGPGKGDEITLLAKAFDEMRLKLKASQEELSTWNRELERRVQQRTQELTALFDASKSLTSTLDLDRVLQNIVSQSQELCPRADAGIIFLYDENLQYASLVAKASFGFHFQTLPSIPLSSQMEAALPVGYPPLQEQCSTEYCSSQAFLTRQPRLCPLTKLPAHLGEGLRKHSPAQEPPVWTSAICIPLLYEDRAIGSLNLYIADPPEGFSQDDVQLIQALANQAAIAIENARLFKEASMVGTLRELDKLKTEFIAMASHELRTPLTSIKSVTETLLRKDLRLKPSEVQEFLGVINNASDRLTKLVNDLLAVSRIESRGLAVAKVPTPIGPIVEKVTGQFRFQAPVRVFHLIVPPGLPPALADPDRLEDIVSNLVSNAIKYSRPEKPVTVAVRLEQGTGETPEEMGATLVVSVTDEGVGIAPQDVGKIFQRFNRIDNPATKATPGVGLGLYISKTYVEAMEGSIWVESQPGEGSTFSFKLPVAQDGSQTKEEIA